MSENKDFPTTEKHSPSSYDRVYKKLKFIQISQYQTTSAGERYLLGSYTNPVETANVLLDELTEAENGRWEIEIIYMTQIEYDALPEFQGY